MTPDPDFDRTYRLLGVEPEDGWDAILLAYRQKAQLYHPDRAGGNPTIERIATQRFEDLHSSFSELKRFYKIFGALPPKGLNHAPARAEFSQRDSGEHVVGTPVRPDRAVASPYKLGSPRHRWAIVAGVVIVLLLALFSDIVPLLRRNLPSFAKQDDLDGCHHYVKVQHEIVVFDVVQVVFELVF